MILFMWQNDIVGVAQFIDACWERMYTSAGPPMGARHLISPDLAGKDAMNLLFFTTCGNGASAAILVGFSSVAAVMQQGVRTLDMAVVLAPQCMADVVQAQLLTWLKPSFQVIWTA
jgi:hypothetical protein